MSCFLLQSRQFVPIAGELLQDARSWASLENVEAAIVAEKTRAQRARDRVSRKKLAGAATTGPDLVKGAFLSA